ncbi:MAG: hypothetical protein JSU94_07910, partial [Phycisphaerales bacterium]
TALVLFGKMTAPSEAAAAGVSVTAATTKVGVAASLASLATSKTGVVSVAAGCILATGAIVGTSWPGLSGALWEGRKSGTSLVWPAAGASEGAEECWYYYPHDVDGPVMMRLVKWNPDGKGSYCKWWQNGGPSHYFDERRNTIHITNERMWDSGLSVVRLPTDGVNMRDFLSMVEGRADRMYYVSARGRGLLVITRWGRGESYDGSQAVRHNNLLDEEYFRYTWPPDATLVDNRDAMHKRGWTYLTVSGRIGKEALSGAGRIPFVYLESEKNYPWLRVKVGERLRLEDDGGAASVYGAAGELLARYKGGSFFKGLGRPWMGLHTIDTVRRDAAEQRVWFETAGESGADKVELSLDFEKLKLVYTIDMNLDVVESIAFESEGDGGSVEGEMRFTYLQEVDAVGDVFAAPRRMSFRRDQRDRLGILWLSKLAADDW